MTSDLRALQLEVADLREEVEDLRAEVVRLRRAITELRTGGLQPTIRESDLESVGWPQPRQQRPRKKSISQSPLDCCEGLRGPDIFTSEGG